MSTPPTKSDIACALCLTFMLAVNFLIAGAITGNAGIGLVGIAWLMVCSKIKDVE